MKNVEFSNDNIYASMYLQNNNKLEPTVYEESIDSVVESEFDDDKNSTLENIQVKNVQVENVQSVNISVENVSDEDLSVENVSDEDLSVENVSDENFSVENVSDEDLSVENVLDENLSVENVLDENLSVENVLDENLSVENVNNVSIDNSALNSENNDSDINEFDTDLSLKTDDLNNHNEIENLIDNVIVTNSENNSIEEFSNDISEDINIYSNDNEEDNTSLIESLEDMTQKSVELDVTILLKNKLVELQNMATDLNIPIKTDSGKKKTKLNLAQDIISKKISKLNIYMSDLNSKYGKSNLCPAIMNDGRGVHTNFKNNKVIVQDLKKDLKANTSQVFRNQLQNKKFKLRFRNFKYKNF